jgi:hypothetical protein
MIFFTDKSDAMVQNTDIFYCGICEQNEENLVDFLRHKLRRECLCFFKYNLQRFVISSLLIRPSLKKTALL